MDQQIDQTQKRLSIRRPLSRVTALKVIGLYVMASLLMAACAPQRDKLTIKIGGNAATDSKPAGDEKDGLSVTGLKTDTHLEYVYMGNAQAGEALRVSTLMKYSEEDKKKSEAFLAEEIGSLDIARSESAVTALLGLKSKEKINGVQQNREVSIVLGVNSAEGVKLSPGVFKDEKNDLSVALTCLDDKCAIGVVEIVRTKDGAKIPYYVEARDVKTVLTKQNINQVSEVAKDMEDVGKGLKRFGFAEVLEKPGKLAVAINTVNMLNLESRFFVGLAGEGSDKLLRRVELRGDLTRIKSTDSRRFGREAIAEFSPVLKASVTREALSDKKMSFELTVPPDEKADEDLSAAVIDFDVVY